MSISHGYCGSPGRKTSIQHQHPSINPSSSALSTQSIHTQTEGLLNYPTPKHPQLKVKTITGLYIHHETHEIPTIKLATHRGFPSWIKSDPEGLQEVGTWYKRDPRNKPPPCLLINPTLLCTSICTLLWQPRDPNPETFTTLQLVLEKPYAKQMYLLRWLLSIGFYSPIYAANLNPKEPWSFHFSQIWIFPSWCCPKVCHILSRC